jgi:hypothetical protein
MSDDRIPRDEAKETVGREIFGDAWVAEITEIEWELAQRYKKGLTTDPAAEEAHAKLKRADRQGGTVGEWFENRGFNTTKEYFDRPQYEAAVAAAFGRVLSSHTKTKFRHPEDASRVRQAITALLKGEVANAYQAAKFVCPRDAPAQQLDRLRKLIMKEWRGPKPPKIANHSQ